MRTVVLWSAISQCFGNWVRVNWGFVMATLGIMRIDDRRLYGS